MHNSTAISYIFSKIKIFFYLGPQLVILTLQVFNMTLQLLHLSCLFLFFFSLSLDADGGIDLLVISSSDCLTTRLPQTNQMWKGESIEL